MGHLRHRDDRWVDNITIDTEPRWKTSGLSGDEWRFGYTVRLWRKGHVLVEHGVGSLEYAAAWVALQAAAGFCPAEQPWPDDAPGQPYGDGHYCDNPGCPEVATWRGELKRRYGRDGGRIPAHQGLSIDFHVFCDAHKRRGDCALEDCDDNYVWTRIEAAA